MTTKSVKMWGVFADMKLIEIVQFKWIGEEKLSSLSMFDNYDEIRDGLKVRPVTVVWEE
jgi:hypothetical protein